MDWLRGLLEGLTRFSDVGLLLMRVLVGFLFVYSGLRKYRRLRKFAEENGLPLIVAFLAVSAEFWGGVGRRPWGRHATGGTCHHSCDVWVDVSPHHQVEESLLGGQRWLGVRPDVVHHVPGHRGHGRWCNRHLAGRVTTPAIRAYRVR